jgi:hypothetical protein
MTDFIYQGVSLVAVIVGLTEVIKKVGLPIRFVPLLSAVLGVLAGQLFLKDWFLGLVFGLSAAGTFDVAKKTVLGK